MADVWRPRTDRLYRRDRSVGTIDGRLIQASRKPDRDETRRPDDRLRNIHFNSGTVINVWEPSPEYKVLADGIIVGLTLISGNGGSVGANLYVNGTKKATLSYNGGSHAIKEDLDIGVDADDVVSAIFYMAGSSTESAVFTVQLLED